MDATPAPMGPASPIDAAPRPPSANAQQPPTDPLPPPAAIAAPPSAPAAWRPHRQSRIFFLAVLVLAGFLTWLVFRSFIIYMVTGLFVAILAMPIDRAWERLFPNRLAAFFTIFTLIIILMLPLLGLGFALYNDAIKLADAVEEGRAEEWINRTIEIVYPEQTAQERNATIQRFLDEAEDTASAFLNGLAQRLLAGVGRFFLGFTVILFVVYYVLTDGARLAAFLRRATPLPPAQVDFLLGEGHRGLRAVFVGQILTSLIQGTVGGVGLLIAGVPAPYLWAAVMAVLSLLPVVGAFLVWIPAGIFLLIRGDLWQGIFLLAWGALVVSQVDNFVRPKLIGTRADIHPLFVLVGVLGGVAAFGFIGLFLGPVLVGVMLSVLKVWEAEYLERAEPA